MLRMYQEAFADLEEPEEEEEELEEVENEKCEQEFAE